MKIAKETYEKLEKLGKCMYDLKGREILDPRPMVLDVGLTKPLSLQEQIRRVIRTEVSLQAQQQGEESFEESQDFDVEDDFHMEEPTSAYTLAKEEIPVKEVPKRKVVETKEEGGMEKDVGLQDRGGKDQNNGGSEPGRSAGTDDSD